MQLILGDCLEQLALMPDACVDAVVTDPPYGLSFMGKRWDYDVPSVEIWQECLRVLKPGGHLLAFAGTRTQHRMCVNIEDAGFEIKDLVMWHYGAGFPKGINIVNQMIKGLECQLLANAQLVAQSSKSLLVASPEGKEPIAVALAQILPEAVPALITATGEEVGLCVLTDTLLSELEARIGLSMTYSWKSNWGDHWKEVSRFITETETEVTTDSKTWNWLTGLRTSQSTTRESVTLPNGSRWPAVTVDQSLTSESKSLKSIPIATALGSATWNPVKRFRGFNSALKPATEPITVARKPLQAKTVAQNVLEHGTGGINIDACRVPGAYETRDRDTSGGASMFGMGAGGGAFVPAEGRWPANLIHDGSEEVTQLFGDAQRFFYVPKCSKADREDGNIHPTVKPTDLMAYLCRLVTPPGGIVLDPFMGSGSTGKAAIREGFGFIGIEREAEYFAIAQQRVQLPEQQQLSLVA